MISSFLPTGSSMPNTLKPRRVFLLPHLPDRLITYLKGCIGLGLYGLLKRPRYIGGMGSSFCTSCPGMSNTRNPTDSLLIIPSVCFTTKDKPARDEMEMEIDTKEEEERKSTVV